MKQPKIYYICVHSSNSFNGTRKVKYLAGTFQEFINYYKYTLSNGKCYEYEKGKKKINLEPKTIASLVTNVNNALNNSARNGYSNTWIEAVKEIPEDYRKGDQK